MGGMVQINEMSKEEVKIAIANVWAPMPAPEYLHVFVHTDGVDALLEDGGGFQCLVDDGLDVDIDGKNEFAVQCHQAGPGEPFLAVVDVVITDDYICGTN